MNTEIQQGTATAILTGRGFSGTSSEYTLTVSANVNYGRTRIYCRDISDQNVRGIENICPPTTITTSKYTKNMCVSIDHYLSKVSVPPVSPTNLQFSHVEGTNTILLQWSHVNAELSVTSYAVNIIPNPTDGSCNGGQCIVNPESCIASTTGSICSFNITQLEYSISYNVNVRAMNCQGESDVIELPAIIFLTASESFS